MNEIYEVLNKEDVIPIFIFNELGYVVFPIDQMKKIRKPVFTHIKKEIIKNKNSDNSCCWGHF